jgi:hypothetical protein
MGKRKGSTRTTKKETPVHGIQNLGVAVVTALGGAVHNAEVLAQQDRMILSNPMEYIDDLKRMSPFWANVALRVLTTTIGWYAVNSVLWAYRKRNMEPKVNSSIDWLNDSIALMKEKEQGVVVREEQGFNTLPFVQGERLLGVYKYLFVEITHEQPIASMEMPTPAVLFARMQRERDGDAIMAEYEKFENEQIKNSASFKYLEAAIKDKDAKASIRLQNKMQGELDHIHRELANTKMESFSDDVWMSLPLWAQFKIMRSLHKQVIKAVIAEDDKKPEERINKLAIVEMGNTVLLELEAADREPQVREAFAKDVLKEQHALL